MPVLLRSGAAHSGVSVEPVVPDGFSGGVGASLFVAAVNLKAAGVGMMTVLTVNTVITDCLTLQAVAVDLNC